MGVILVSVDAVFGRPVEVEARRDRICAGLTKARELLEHMAGHCGRASGEARTWSRTAAALTHDEAEQPPEPLA